MKYLVSVGIALLCVGCATTNTSTQTYVGNKVPDTDSVEALVDEGYRVLTGDRFPRKAIEDYFNPAIARCEADQAASDARLYVARSQPEMLMYLLQSAASDTSAEIIQSACPDAYFLKGYSLIDLGEPEDAERTLLEGLEWSPLNSAFLSELGHLRHVDRDWKGAIEYFERARDAADGFAPEELRVTELTRAIRGIGFSLIEIGDLDGAETLFNESLELDPADERSPEELQYIQKLRADGA